MPETERLAEVFERDFREIPLPGPDLWFPASQVVATRRWTRRLVLAAVLGVALIGALVLGNQIRQLRGSAPDVAAPPTTASVLTKLKIAGIVVDAQSGRPIENVSVYVLRDEPAIETTDFHPVGFNYDVKWRPAGKAVTDASGRYTFQAFPGRYRVTFVGWRGVPYGPWQYNPRVVTDRPYAPLWWPDAPTDVTATVLDLRTDRGDIDAALHPAHEISGTLTSAATGLQVPSAVYLYAAGATACCAIAVEAGVSQDGVFRAAVPDGRYKILFVPMSVSFGGLGTGFDPRWWGNAPDFDHASEVVVAGNDVIGLEFVYGTGPYTHAPPLPAIAPPSVPPGACQGRLLPSSYLTSDYVGPARVTAVYGPHAFRVVLIAMANSRSDPNVEVTSDTKPAGLASVDDLGVVVGSLLNIAVCAKDYDPAKTVGEGQGFHQLYSIGPRY